MRLNVDDFDGMVDFLKAQGYEFAFGPSMPLLQSSQLW